MSRWCYPVLPFAQYSVQAGCGFLDDAYYRATCKRDSRGRIIPSTGSVHPGDDYNGLGGRNTDLGEPVYAASDGQVVHAAWHRVWGNIILIHHPADRVWSMYAHLGEMRVRPGAQVRCGQQIGTIGRGGVDEHGNYLYFAHLHFEIRTADVLPDEWPSTTMAKAKAEEYIGRTRVNTQDFLHGKNAARSLAELLPPPNVGPRPPAPTVNDIPALPLPEANGRAWEPVYDADTDRPIPGLWVSLRKNRKTGEGRIYKVKPDKLKAKGLN